VNEQASARLVGSALLGVGGLFFAIVVQRPEPAVVGAPFLVFALVAMLSLGGPTVTVSAALNHARVVEGEWIELRVEVVTDGSRGRAQVRVVVPDGVSATSAHLGKELLVSAIPSVVEETLEVTRWGPLGPVVVEVDVSDPLGTFTRSITVPTEPIQVLPTESTLRRVVSPRALRSIAGSHHSRQRGDGIEHIDSRPFVPGDRARSVNWRVTARRGELWVDQRRPERSGEVVLFLDTFATLGDHLDNTLRRTVDLAVALATSHVAVNDRIGLADLGGVLRWVRPGGGTIHLYRLVETLMATEAYATFADKTIDVLPMRAFPQRSLIVALSPLLDPRGIDAVKTLRARGFDVAVIEISPLDLTGPEPGRRGDIAFRLWNAEHRAIRHDLRTHGIAVAEWREAEPAENVIRRLEFFRQAVLRAAR
jgi:uncharacterized protein (DUF58 family)